MRKLCHIQYFRKFFSAQDIWLQLKGVGRIEEGLRNVAIAIDTRGRILRTVVADGRRRIENLLQSVPEGRIRAGSAKIDDEIVYGVLQSVDAFFFEAFSLYELLKRFYVSVLRRAKIEGGKQAHESFATLVGETQSSRNFNWQQYLEAHRNVFHETVPYVAVEVAGEDPSQRVLVVESEPDVYLRPNDFDKVLKGLERLATLCKDDLSSKIARRGN